MMCICVQDGGEGHVKLLPANSGRLVTATQFDREKTPSVNFQLVCIVTQVPKTNPTINQLFVVTQNVSLIIADEDDNPPRLQSPEEQSVVDVYLKDKGITLVSLNVT